MVGAGVVLLGFVVVGLNEWDEPNGSLLYQCCSSVPLEEVMSWMSWVELQWWQLTRVVLQL